MSVTAAPTIDLSQPYQVLEMSTEDFLMGMAALGMYQDLNLVGSFEKPEDQTKRTAHRDIPLPFHRDGIESRAIADLQGGMYIEKPNVDVVGMYCLRDNHNPDGSHIECHTILAEAAPDADPYDDTQFSIIAKVDLRPGQALIWDNRLWHGREGEVGTRLLIRFWTTCPALYEVRP